MADNLTIVTSSGTAAVATKDIASVHFQKVIEYNSAGTAIDPDTKIGALTETAPATDTASSGVNGRLQRLAQRLTSLIALVPTALSGSGNFKVAVTEDTFAGSLTEVAPATDTGTSGLNGRLQRIAQRLTSLIDLFPTSAASWSYSAVAGGIVNTTGVTVKSAAGVGVKNYITWATFENKHATVSTEVEIRDGGSGTVKHRAWAQAVGGGKVVQFDPPLAGSANTMVEVACVTTGSAVLVNMGGYTGA